MEWWSKIRKGWIKVARLLGIRKTGLLKLRHDVRTCEYEDVHVLWEMLKRNDTGVTRSAAGVKTNCFVSIVGWAKRAPVLCHQGV